jgi:hypothetical protein
VYSLTDEKKAPHGSTVKVTISKGAKKEEPKVAERHYGPPPILDEGRRIPRPINLVISDISTLYLTQNRINNGTVSEIILGRAVIMTTLPRSHSGDTYGDSLVEFTEDTIEDSNENLLRFLDSIGG